MSPYLFAMVIDDRIFIFVFIYIYIISNKKEFIKKENHHARPNKKRKSGSIRASDVVW